MRTWNIQPLMTLRSWPLVLAQAAVDAGWNPKAENTIAETVKLLEMFTGYKGHVTANVTDAEGFCK